MHRPHSAQTDSRCEGERVAAVRRPRIRALVALVIVSTVIFTACEDFESGEPPRAGVRHAATSYATRVCKRLITWTGRIQAMGEAVPSTPLAPADAQQQILALMSSAADATDRLLVRLEGLEPPDLEGADVVHGSILDAVAELLGIMGDLRDEVATLQIDSAEDLQETVEQMATTMSEEARAIEASLHSQTGPAELAAAFNEVESCETLGP